MVDVEFIKSIRQAIKEDNVKEVEKLIGDDKEKLNTVTPLGSWLHEAAKLGYIDLAKKLLDMGIDVTANYSDDENEPWDALQLATDYGKDQIVEILKAALNKRGINNNGL